MDFLTKLNNTLGEIEKKLNPKKSADQIDAETKEMNEAIAQKNSLTIDSLPGAAMSSKVCTDDAFYDLTCASSYLLSQLFASGFKGSNLDQNFLVKVIDKKVKLFFLPNGTCKPGNVNKNAKKVNIKQSQIGGACEIDFSMFIGGRSRATVLKNVIDEILKGGFLNSVEDRLINGDVRNTTANINGQTAAITGDLPSYLGANGLRVAGLVGYEVYDPNVGETTTFTPYAPADLAKTTYDFNETLTIDQFLEFAGKLGCCEDDKLFIMDCDTFSKLEVLASTQAGSMKEIVDGAGFVEAGSLFRFMGRTIYKSDNVGKVLPTGLTDAVDANNSHHYIIGVNKRAVLWGFGTEIASGNESEYGCETLWTRAALGQAICTSPEMPNVVIGINIK